MHGEFTEMMVGKNDFFFFNMDISATALHNPF